MHRKRKGNLILMTSTSMTKKQVFELLKFLRDAYPNLEVTQSRVDTWSKFMKDQNPAIVMRKAEEHVLNNKFPPTISDLIVIPFKKSRDQIEHEKMLRENGLL